MASLISGLFESLFGAVENTMFSSLPSERAPLLPNRVAQNVSSSLNPETAATVSSLAETATSAIGIGQLALDIMNIKSPITGDSFVGSQFSTLQEANKREAFNPNEERAKQYLGSGGIQLNIQNPNKSPSVPEQIPEQLSGRLENLSGVQNLFNRGIEKVQSSINTYNNTYGKQNPLSVATSGTIYDPMKVGKDLGRFIGLTEHELYKGSSQLDAFKNTSMSFPDLAYLLMSITRFSTYAPKPDVLAKVNQYRQIYTGANVTPQNTFVDANGNIGLRSDEFGNQQIYDGARGNLPAYDTFCGPQSPNNARPTTLFGTYCMLHDIGYLRRGYFDLESDLQLVARIMNNQHLMSTQERVLALSAAHYFLTTGNSIAMFKGSLPSNVNERPVSQQAQDISREIFGSQLSPTQRQRFYEGLKQGLEENLKMMMTPSKYNSTSLLPLFDQIEVYEAFDLVDEPQESSIPTVPINPPADVPLEQVPDVIAESTLPTTTGVDHPPILDTGTGIVEGTNAPIIQISGEETQVQEDLLASQYQTPVAAMA